MIDHKLTELKLLETEKTDILAMAEMEGETSLRVQQEMKQSQEKFDKLLEEVISLNEKLKALKDKLKN